LHRRTSCSRSSCRRSSRCRSMEKVPARPGSIAIRGSVQLAWGSNPEAEPSMMAMLQRWLKSSSPSLVELIGALRKVQALRWLLEALLERIARVGFAPNHEHEHDASAVVRACKSTSAA